MTVSLRGLAVTASVAAICLGSACGDSDSSAERRSVVVRATDPGAREVGLDAPASVKAGLVDIVLENAGRTPHDAQLFRVEGRRSARDVVSFIEAYDYDPKPAWLHPEGGVAAVSPGDAATVTQVLEPGTYYVADTQEREAGVSNAASGGVARLEVTGRPKGRLPSTSARITARDDGFEATGVPAGDGRVAFRNAGEEWHQVVAYPLPAGASFARAKRAAVQRELDRDTRWMPVGVPAGRATTVLEGGGEQIVELSLDPGRYVLMCFAQDRAGGPPHFSLGVASELVVR